MPTHDGDDQSGSVLRADYDQHLADLRDRFTRDGDGIAAVHGRTEAVDALLRALWAEAVPTHSSTHSSALNPTQSRLSTGLAVVAVGGYGRRQLFPFSDIDLLFCTEKAAAAEMTSCIRGITQALWDCGLRVAAATRTMAECDRYSASDPEGGLALLDLRFVAGDKKLYQKLEDKLHGKRSPRDVRALSTAAAELTRQRHARFGNTLFHLEPNVKDAPGGLRDANTTHWLTLLREGSAATEPHAALSHEAFAFMTAVRVFLHFRHGRDDNTLDWHAQDEAATQAIGLPRGPAAPAPNPDPAYWMRLYFRHARVLERTLQRQLELSGQRPKPCRAALRAKAPPRSGFTVEDGTLSLKAARAELDPAGEPEIVLAAFGLLAETGIRLAPASEERLAAAIPALSAALEDGPLLWTRFRRVLCGDYAGHALRSMHALGLLDLIVPEFHGIDSLVIRDAYHRYTVDEHTFVLLDALHGLADAPPHGAPEWRLRFRQLLRDLPHPELLYLAALLHDTGKSRSTPDHAQASAQLADGVTRRLELEPFDCNLVHRLIECHLEMSAALRRDIFDAETVRVFADKIGTHDLLRLLTLFTFADISAVHPDALTPWKAENLWRLWMAAENQLDRSVDQDRVHAGELSSAHEAASIARALNLQAGPRAALESFLEGAPERYLRTRSPETLRQHMEAALSGDKAQILLTTGTGSHEVTVITADRPRLFADLTGALSGWGMNIVSAEAFSNVHGTVVDTFRFTDPFKTLELNPEERERFRTSLRSVVLGTVPVEPLLSARRRAPRRKPRRLIETRIEFDNMSSAQSTLMQIVAQDETGLLHQASLALSEFGCSVEIALIDTEGEVAIDVFYLTKAGAKLNEAEQYTLRRRLERKSHGPG